MPWSIGTSILSRQRPRCKKLSGSRLHEGSVGSVGQGDCEREEQHASVRIDTHSEGNQGPGKVRQRTEVTVSSVLCTETLNSSTSMLSGGGFPRDFISAGDRSRNILCFVLG